MHAWNVSLKKMGIVTVVLKIGNSHFFYVKNSFEKLGIPTFVLKAAIFYFFNSFLIY